MSENISASPSAMGVTYLALKDTVSLLLVELLKDRGPGPWLAEIHAEAARRTKGIWSERPHDADVADIDVALKLLDDAIICGLQKWHDGLPPLDDQDRGGSP